MSPPTLVFIGGGWHIPASYSKLVNALKVAGYDVHIPAHPSMEQSRPPTNDLATDTASMRKYVGDLVDSGRTVTVVMHSYGGQVGTNALYDMGVESRSRENLSGGVSLLIYMCAFALPENGSLMKKVDEMGDHDLMPMAFDFADDGTVVPRDSKLILVGSPDGTESDEAEIDAFLATLVRWNGKCMYDSITNTAWRHIPIAYILTKQDFTVPFHYQQSMVDALRSQGRAVKTIELDAGHSPNLTKTKEVVDAINDVTGWKQMN